MKTVAIAGAGSGIGRSAAVALADAGFAVALIGRTEASILSTQLELQNQGARCVAVIADLSIEKEAERAFSEIDRFSDRLDILINSTGVFDYHPIDQLSLQDWNKVMQSTLTAPFLCAREAFKRMKQQQSGRIINIGSTSGKRVRPEAIAYSTAKHGIWGMTQTLALEGRPFNINCSCINPGRVSVERTHLEGCAEPAMTADEFAQILLSICQLPDHINLLDATVMHHGQPFVGRG